MTMVSWTRARIALSCAPLLLACSKEPETSREEAAVALPAVDVTGLPEALRSFHAPDLALEGEWIAEWARNDASTMSISCLEAGESYRLVLTRSYPSQPTRFETIADWKDGALWPRGNAWTLELTRGHLYPARVAGTDCLVPSESLEFLAQGSLFGGKQEHAFRRAPPPAPEPEEFEELDLRELRRLRGHLPGPDEEIPFRKGGDVWGQG